MLLCPQSGTNSAYAKEYLDDKKLIEVTSDTNAEKAAKVPTKSESAEDAEVDKEYEAYKQKLMEKLGSQRAYIETRLGDLRSDLKNVRGDFRSTSGQIREYENKLEPLKDEIISLKKQVEMINTELGHTRIKIEHAIRQIYKKQDVITGLLSEIESEALKLKDHREKLKQYATLLYQEEQQFLSVSSREPSILKMLVADQSLSNSFLQMSYVRSISKQIEETMYEYEIIKQNLLEKEELVDKHRRKLINLNNFLVREKRNLAVQAESKTELLAITKGEEERYQELLETAREEHKEAAEEIEKLKGNIGIFERKFAEYKLHEENIDSFAHKLRNDPMMHTVLETEYEQFFESDDSSELRWPIQPTRGISAQFMDANYPFKKQIGNHKGIDVPAPQGTVIHSPRTAVVGKIKAPTSESYAYVVLVHGNNIMTVYGHVSEVFVEEGQLVQEGDIIALTGGAVGSHGAGWATTGPHLHFEVYKNGRHINPLELLPWSEIDLKYIPKELKEARVQERSSSDEQA